MIRQHNGAGMTGLGPKVGKLWEKGRFRYPYLRENLWQHGYAVDTLETSVNWDKTNATIHAIENGLRNALADEGKPSMCSLTCPTCIHKVPAFIRHTSSVSEKPMKRHWHGGKNSSEPVHWLLSKTAELSVTSTA